MHPILGLFSNPCQKASFLFLCSMWVRAWQRCLMTQPTAHDMGCRNCLEYVQQSHLTYAIVCYLCSTFPHDICKSMLSQISIPCYLSLWSLATYQQYVDEVSIWYLSLVAHWHELIAVCVLLLCVYHVCTMYIPCMYHAPYMYLGQSLMLHLNEWLDKYLSKQLT